MCMCEVHVWCVNTSVYVRMRKRLGIHVGHACMCVLHVLYLGVRERECVCVCVLGGRG